MIINLKNLEEKFNRSINLCLVLKNKNQILKETNKKINLSLSFDDLNLGQKLYGNSKQESSVIQKKNCKFILKLFSKVKKTIKFLIKNKIDFNETIFIEKLQEKKNNNDILLAGFLDIEFNKTGKKYEKIISYSCDFLSRENNLNNMCDFSENKCVSCRERKIDRAIGCCQKNCKFVHEGVCKVKNISCKLYMCGYVEDRGFYFSPYYQPLLKKYFLFTQIVACRCMLFKSLDFEVKTLKATKVISLLILLAIFIILGLKFIL